MIVETLKNVMICHLKEYLKKDRNAQVFPRSLGERSMAQY